MKMTRKQQAIARNVKGWPIPAHVLRANVARSEYGNPLAKVKDKSPYSGAHAAIGRGNKDKPIPKHAKRFGVK